MKKRLVIFVLVGMSSCRFSAGSERDLSDPRSLENALRESPTVLVNRQGWAQADLSIRGASYTASGLSINGLKIKTPYSAHFNADLPLSGTILSQAKTQVGLENVALNLVGTAAYTTRRQDREKLEAGAAIGTKEHYAGNISVFLSNIGSYMNWEKARKIDYKANDYERTAVGVQFQHVVKEWQIDFISSAQSKQFGAQGYYEIPSTQYAEQKTEDGLLYLGAMKGDIDDTFFRTSAAWRQFDDEYATTGQHHDVPSYFGSVMAEGRTMEIQNISLHMRADFEHEQVKGSVGDHERIRGSVLIHPQISLEKISFSLGVNSVFLSSESTEFLPLAGVRWFATDNSIVYLSYSETFQRPDYQTLENNPFLHAQHARKSEFGFKQIVSENFDWRLTSFYRHLKNASDWVGGNVVDLGSINVGGVEAEIGFYPSDDLALKLFYQWVRKDNQRTDGFYELDYPEHLLAFTGDWQFFSQFVLFATQTLRYQTENDRRTSSSFGADASMGFHWIPRFAQKARISLRVDNLWGTTFQSLPGLKPPARTINTGVSIIW